MKTTANIFIACALSRMTKKYISTMIAANTSRIPEAERKSNGKLFSDESATFFHTMMNANAAIRLKTELMTISVLATYPKT